MALVNVLALFALVVAGRPTSPSQVSFSVAGVEHQVDSSSAPVPVWTWMAALLAMSCVALGLFVVIYVRFQMPGTAWQFLTPFRQPQDDLFQADHLESAQTDSELDDVDEKYQDALDITPIQPFHDLPLDDNVFNTSHSADPPLPSLGSHPPDPPAVDPSTTPISLPAWSVRAIDSPALGLPSSSSQPLELIHPPQPRAYRSPVPEFDLALAMQLRPGVGIGIAADSAWMVRFLMAIFGWFAVALTGNTR